MERKEIVLSLSGGMDSTTLLATLLDHHFLVHPFQFIYGSKHNSFEHRAVVEIAKYYGLSVPVIDMTEAFSQIRSNLLVSGESIPEGHYNNSNMSKTVVPGRNSIFISVLTGIAESLNIPLVALGIHAGDHAIYPDCRSDYFEAMNITMKFASDGKVRLFAPFLSLDKADICKIGQSLNVPYHLTRTCYKDQPTACGKCGSCQERLWAFSHNGQEDPLEYESRNLFQEEEHTNE